MMNASSKPTNSEMFNTSHLTNIAMTPLHSFDTIVEVVNADILTLAGMVADPVNAYDNDAPPPNIVILNTGSQTTPGGSVNMSCPPHPKIQEEEIYKRTNCQLSLWTYKSRKFYPLSTPAKKTNVIYTRGVHLLKDEEYNNICGDGGDPSLLHISMVTASPIKNPDFSGIEGKRKNKKENNDFITTLTTLDNVFRLCYLKGHDTLILGAFGFGNCYKSYNNPPMEIIKIYNILLRKYNGCFKKVIFAISDLENFYLFNRHIVVCL